MKRSKKKSVQTLFEHSFKPLERTKEGLLLGGFGEIAAYGSDNCQCNGNNCQCTGNNCQCNGSNNCQCSGGNNCQCSNSTTTATTASPTQIVPTTCSLFF